MKKLSVFCLLIVFFMGCGSVTFIKYRKKSEPAPNIQGFNKVWNYSWQKDLDENYLLEFFPSRFLLYGAMAVAGNVIYEKTLDKEEEKEKSRGKMVILDN